MKKIAFGLVLTAMAASVAFGGSEITVDYMSAYVWRGQVLNSAAVVQPGMTVETPFGLALNAWGNMDATKKNEEGGKFNEIDLTADYAVPLGEDMPVALNIGVINYTFPYLKSQADGGADDTSEVYASVGVDVISAPFVTAYYDFDNVNGAYIVGGVSHSFALAEAVALDLGVSLAWADSKYNEAYFGEEANSAGFNDLNLSAGVGYELTEELGVGVSVLYSRLIDSKVKDGGEASYGNKDIIYGGISMAYAF